MSSPKRARFFAESLRLIHSKGYKGTTMRDIAASLDCDVANLYNFVKSKDEILEASLFQMSAIFHEGITRISKSKYLPTGKIQQIIQLYVRMTFERPYEISLLVSGWRHLPDPKRKKFIEEKSSYESKVRQVIEEGMNSGELKAIDPELATALVLSSVRWLFDKYADKMQVMNPVEVERQISEFVLTGLSS